LIRETDPNIQMRATYALGCLGKHSSDHAKALAENDVLNNLMQILINPNSIEELKKECRRALKMIIQNCTSVQALDKIITDVSFNFFNKSRKPLAIFWCTYSNSWPRSYLWTQMPRNNLLSIKV
jgi:hypothetical protein